jgi:hypothetical protein
VPEIKKKDMKRSVLLFLGMMWVWGLFAQDTTLTGIVPVDAAGKITWQAVIQVKDVDKDKLYNKGIEWINSYFPNPAGVTKRRSPESGIIEGAHSIRLTNEVNGKQVPAQTITYTFKLEFRDGRFRYTITDFQLKAASKFPLERWLDRNGPYYDLNNRKYLIQIRDVMEDMISKMTNSITKPEPPAEEEW